MRRLFVVLAMLAGMMPGVGMAADLVVTVSGLKNDRGDLHVALYDNPAAFPNSDGMRTETRVAITNRRAELTFPGLTPGHYAIAAYHDENGNDSFDQGLFGLPLEDYAFSNDATVFFAPPSFDEAAFTVQGPVTGIDVRFDK